MSPFSPIKVPPTPWYIYLYSRSLTLLVLIFIFLDYVCPHFREDRETREEEREKERGGLTA
jgi:hypothetical protein